MASRFKQKYEKLRAWSYSVYTQYNNCPYSVCLDKIQRVRMPEEDNAAFVKGNQAHAIAEDHVSGPGKRRTSLEFEVPAPVGTRLKPVKVSLKHLKAKFDQLRKAEARTEQEWAFDKDWNRVDWKDWARAWLRIKTDICADTVAPPTVDIIDWKTGRVHPEHKQQRSLYALGGLQLVQLGELAGGKSGVKLTASHTYMETGQTATEQFTMENLGPLKREWMARTKQMLNDTTYPTKPGRHCSWCPHAKSKGGVCPENQ